MKIIYLLGTGHQNQFGPCEEFKQFLSDLCYNKKIKVVAEEMNDDALLKQGVNNTIPHHVALQLSLMHRYCDPDKAKQDELGIKNEGLIKMQGKWDDLSPNEIQNQINKEHRKRERFWLEEIKNISNYPILFICGSNHVLPFDRLLSDSGYQCSIIHEDWSPNNRLQGTA